MLKFIQKHPVAKALSLGLAAGFMIGLGGVAQAAPTTIVQGLVPNTNNLIIDESREAYVDSGPNGTADGIFGVGDVIVGYIKISSFSTSGKDAGNAVYGIFTQQVTAINGQVVTFGATTTAGLTLSNLTGVAVAPGGIIALYDNPAGFGVDLEVNAPGGATTMKDYTDYIKNNGSLELIAGINPADPNNFLHSVSALAGAPTANLIGIPSSVTIANTAAGLDISLNNTPFGYAHDVIASSPVGESPLFFTLNDIAASSGTVAGTGTAGTGLASPNPQTWLSAAGYGNFTQCSVPNGEFFINTPCGFIDKNNFNIHPTQVPEPGSLLLLGVALLATGGAGTLRKKK